MRLTAGSTLGPYEISGAIGAGGMGEVYRARDTRLGREVAVKILPRDVSGDPQRLARFELEARSTSALNHPNIVTIHDFATAGDDCYLVMELIRGESLREVIQRGPVTGKKLFALAAGIAGGLAAAHAAGIVHRDLKPENVMVTPDGTPKILDFGLVKSTPAISHDSPTEARVTSEGVVLGTLTYMSPEQARGQSVGFTSDQFSLGVMLYELATARHPFRRSNGYETASAILTDEAPPMGDAVPEPFVWIVERCLSKSPEDRYASTTDLARDLAMLQERGSSQRRVDDPTRSRPRSISFLLVALTLATLALATFIALRRTPDATSIASLRVDVATGELVPSLDEVGAPIAISPDGTHLLVNGAGGKSPNELWVIDLRTRAMRMITDNAFAGSWSNDGKGIAFFADGKLKTVPLEGGPPTIVCDARPEGTPSWHGNTILFVQFSGGRDQSGIFRADIGGGAPRLIVGWAESGSLPWWPQFLADGKRFLYTAMIPSPNGVGHEVRLASLDGGPSKRIASFDSRTMYSKGHLLYVRDGTLMAQPFDPDKAQLSGEAVPILDRLHYFRPTALAAFSLSNNGILAVRTARRPTRLVMLDRNGLEVDSFATGLFEDGGHLSRDGSRYAVGMYDPNTAVGDVWSYDLNRRNGERMTIEPEDQGTPVWGRDDRSIYFKSDGYGGPPDIVHLQPGQKAVPVYQGPGVDQPEDVSPDGRSLLFQTFHPVSADIHVLPLEPPGPPRPFATTQYNEFSPRFSPDGKLVAYASNVSGRPEVYVRPFAGAAAATRVSRDGGLNPRWSRDGKELLFLAPGGRVMTVAVSGGFGEPRMLFQAAGALSFEPSPNPNRFVVHLSEAFEPPIQLLINWPALLKK